jgi:two-component system CheB/CheR fusion protein
MRSHVEFKLIKGNENDIELFTDPQILTNILQNLINNSFFFTKEGFVRFGYREHASGIEFFVEDSGSGIEDGNKEMIFRPFFKGNNPVIGNKGFGLGLAISKGMVNLLGGELKFESTPNVGSRFYFELDNEHILAKSIK